MIFPTVEEVQEMEKDDSSEEIEMARIANLVESPLQAYARYLARMDTINPKLSDMMRIRYPVTKLVKADVEYAWKTWKNRIWTINGQCLDYSTIIPTFNEGKIVNVKIGDNLWKEVTVFSVDMKSKCIGKSIALIRPMGMKSCYKLTFSDDESIICSFDHIFYKDFEEAIETKDIVKGTKLLCGNEDLFFFVIVKEIEYVGLRQIADITMVEHNIYLLANGLITHNTGTLKSFSAMSMAIEWLDRNGWYTHNKGNYDLPKLFYDQSDMINWIQTSYKEGDAIILDEEVDTQGVGQRGIQAAMHNLERAFARYARLNIIFVYVVERHHQNNTLFYTRGEHYSVPPIADYGGLGVLQPMSGGQDNYQLLGVATVNVPKQRVIEAYNKRKKEFVDAVGKSGGLGTERDIVKANANILKKLAKDEYFLKLPKKKRATYASYKHHIQHNVAEILMELVDF